MIQKYLLTDLGTGHKKLFKSLNQIAEEYHLEYHQVRSVYLESVSPKRFLHETAKYLCTIMKIERNTIYKNGFVPNNFTEHAV